jgi:hypothetical protein
VASAVLTLWKKGRFSAINDQNATFERSTSSFRSGYCRLPAAGGGVGQRNNIDKNEINNTLAF